MTKRKIIKIDEEKCNGCGLCIPNCKEGALKIIDGKARLVSDVLCDGLGACLGHCPQGAITIEERDAAEYDERKVAAHRVHEHMGGCPGSKTMDFRDKKKVKKEGGSSVGKNISQLKTWPVQIMLVSPTAPYFKGADLLIAADCVPFAYADFHEDLLKDRILLVGCPKLDDVELYKEKIGKILKLNDIKSIACAHMEVPCCFGFVSVVQDAIRSSGKDIPFREVIISIDGEKMK